MRARRVPRRSQACRCALKDQGALLHELGQADEAKAIDGPLAREANPGPSTRRLGLLLLLLLAHDLPQLLDVCCVLPQA